MNKKSDQLPEVIIDSFPNVEVDSFPEIIIESFPGENKKREANSSP